MQPFIRRLGKTCFSVFLLVVLASCSAKESSPLLAGGKRWVSDDKQFSVAFPKGWSVGGMAGDFIAQDPESKTVVSYSVEPFEEPVSKGDKLKELESIALSNAPWSMGSSDVKLLEAKSGPMGKFPAGWAARRYTDTSLGSRVTMAYVLLINNQTLILRFHFTPEESYKRLRPVFDAIASSVRAG